MHLADFARDVTSVFCMDRDFNFYLRNYLKFLYSVKRTQATRMTALRDVALRRMIRTDLSKARMRTLR